MATAKKPAATSAKSAKPAAPAKKVAPAAKKTVAASKPAAKASGSSNHKKVAAAPPAKKAAPAKAPVKQASIVSKSATTNKTVSKAPAAAAKAKAPAVKETAKPAPAPVKKAAVKAVPAPVVKKAAPATKVVSKAAPVKETPAPAPAKKAAPVAKVPEVKATPVKEPAAPKAPKAPKVAKPSKTAIKNVAAILANKQPQPKPSPAPAAYIGRDEKKSNIIVAHRRLESKNKEEEDNGKTMINYQPDFTRSILGKAEENSGPVYRYSDEELNEFRELIGNRLESARKELSYQQGLITRKDEAGTEDTENRYMNMEDGSGAMEREQLAQLASRQIQFINHLEKALIRIENKTYGICRVTGNLIDKARLRAVPHATLSIEAKKMMGSK